MRHSQQDGNNSTKELIEILRGINLQSSPVELAKLFTKTIDERNAARRCLSLALATIQDLETHLDEHRSILMETQAILSEHVRSEQGYLSFLMAAEPRWILDTWISLPANEKLLGVVEYKWSRGETQRALNELCLVRKGIPTSGIDWILCLLIETAILCSCDEHLAAHSNADEALIACEALHREGNFTVARELSGIANFLHGKVFMAEKDWDEAYSAFSEALFVPGYQSRANELKAIACRESNREEPQSESSSEESEDSADS
ncbi:uncharacterized protein GIQ15_04966 [Arthroderma uncinatum]|uniref:uncharacterized protein n=1 Tax=Arthroderma uncinatum TaxID=74035 RepID=UPI00144ADA11|nr:uncharacterized protein GIQ15_04966 [Arthroderma uncinatum]KAF3482207.1 hypothetical protein GIQ15_04966 [Arthroderma uncinatum]